VVNVRIVTAEPDALLDTVFGEILTPAFTPDELGTVEQMRASVREGISRVLVALDDSDKPVAAAVGEWSAATRIVLLGYLAVSEHSRSGGIGGQLLEHAVRTWRQELDPRAVLTELEHPAAHPADPDHGDPAARLRFYGRHRTRALDVPYFQPALGPGRHRVYGLVLAALWVGPAGTGAAPDTVDGALVGAYMREYFEDTEGKVPDDPAARALFAALDRPDGIPLLPLDEPAGLPVSVPE
jgi:GNAT superfamily N-acetyltransferase